VLLILAAGWTWDVAGEVWSLNGGAPVWLSLATDLIEAGWIAAIAFFGVLQRPVFETTTGVDEEQTVKGEKYLRSALKQDGMIRIAAKLELAMTQDKLFADPELSLRALSDRTGISENYISQTLNDQIGRNFFDFVNGYRVAEACRRLETTRESIVAIAFAVGFQSRSTFNAAFKRHTGTTPREHRAARANTVSASALVSAANDGAPTSI
jgi:AraC-like DNA-binding protein